LVSDIKSSVELFPFFESNWWLKVNLNYTKLFPDEGTIFFETLTPIDKIDR
jgi:hypothetical protein